MSVVHVVDSHFNVCEDVLKEMRNLGFPPEFVSRFKNHELFRDAYEKHYLLQRTILTSLLFKILMSGTQPPPAEIRLALNSANDIISWLSDIKLVILPFIKENLDKLHV